MKIAKVDCIVQHHTTYCFEVADDAPSPNIGELIEERDSDPDLVELTQRYIGIVPISVGVISKEVFFEMCEHDQFLSGLPQKTLLTLLNKVDKQPKNLDFGIKFPS